MMEGKRAQWRLFPRKPPYERGGLLQVADCVAAESTCRTYEKLPSGMRCGSQAPV